MGCHATHHGDGAGAHGGGDGGQVDGRDAAAHGEGVPLVRGRRSARVGGGSKDAVRQARRLHALRPQRSHQRRVGGRHVALRRRQRRGAALLGGRVCGNVCELRFHRGRPAASEEARAVDDHRNEAQLVQEGQRRRHARRLLRVVQDVTLQQPRHWRRSGTAHKTQ